MYLSKEEIDSCIISILDGDNKDFDKLYESTYRIVMKVAAKWIGIVGKVSRQLYDFDDLCEEMWVHVLSNIHTYDGTKSEFTTWLYLVCESAASRLLTSLTREKRKEYSTEEEGSTLVTSLNLPVGQGEDTELMELIGDNTLPLEDVVMSEYISYDYIYLIKLLIEQLKDKYKQIYIHQLIGLTLEQSGDIIGISRERVRQVRVIIDRKFKKLLYKYNNNLINISEAPKFSSILLSDLTDDEISIKYNQNLASVKICRIALSAAGIYSKEVIA